MVRKGATRWYAAGAKTGWRKEDSSEKRRRTVLRSRRGNVLAAARSLQALSNVTKDPTTKRLARSDALYFFGKYKRKKK